MDAPPRTTLVTVRATELFDAVVAFEQDDALLRTQGAQRVTARVVPNGAFVQRYGAHAAVGMMSYLRPYDTSGAVVLLQFKLFKPPRADALEGVSTSLHLFFFHSAAAKADPQSMRELESDLGVPASVFHRLGGAALRAVVQLIASGTGLQSSDVVTLEADPYDALVRYYTSLGFVSLRRPTPTQNWEPMRATVGALLRGPS